jgi:ribose 5-phosphate isomerase B
MRVHLGSDHAGLDLKQRLAGWLLDHGHQPVDHGAFHRNDEDDYPVFCLRAAQGVVADQQGGVPALGVVIGGSGNGEQISANKVAGVRCALAWSQQTARLAREHNDANVISIGARMHSDDEAVGFVETFLDTAFSGDPRHQRRIDMLSSYEGSGELPPLPEADR